MESLRPTVDRQSAEHHDRNGIRHIASYAACCQLMRNGASCHGVVAAHATTLIGHDEGATRTACLVDQRPALEPLIERRFAAIELIQWMRRRQGLRRPELQLQALVDFLPQGALTAIRRSRPTFGAAGASSSLLNCRNLSALRLKN